MFTVKKKTFQYEVTYAEAIKPIGTVSSRTSTSKYDKPPKIPVRLTEKYRSVKRRIVTLKKPSSYKCPCIMPKPFKKLKTVVEEPKHTSTLEVVAEDAPAPEETESDHFCKCGPSNYNKNAQFELNIEVTTSNEVLNLTQKLKPFDPENPVEELKLNGAVKIKDDGENESKEGETGFKHVEYR